MAFREIRIYRHSQDRRLSVADDGISLAFSFYMDLVMRGRFREYSGPEVKGVNIVNIFLVDVAINSIGNMNPSRDPWGRMMNMYNREIPFDFARLTGDRVEKVRILVDVFLEEARKSKLPQMVTLVKHTEDSIGEIDINKAIDRADTHLRDLRARVSKAQSTNKEAEVTEEIRPERPTAPGL